MRPSLLAALGLCVVAAVLYGSVPGTIPFEEDNVHVLSWAASTPAARIVSGDPHYYPEWRPLAYATIWFQQRITGDRIPPQFVVNLAIWIACAWLVFRITNQATGSVTGAACAAVLLLADPRATWVIVTIVDRQNSLACLFGLLATLVIVRRDASPLSVLDQGLATLLLLAAVLSKEYGGAFLLGIGAYGLVLRRRDLVGPATMAAVTYMTGRAVFVGLTTQPYCESMYFFNTARDVCLQPSDPASYPQMAYNALSTLVNLPLLGLLSPTGEPNIAESRLFTGVVTTLLSGVALARGPRSTRVLAAIVIANAAVSVPLYRERNQVAGACALAVLTGIGIDYAAAWFATGVRRSAGVAIIAAVIATQALLARALVVERTQLAAAIEPCDLEIMDRPFVPPYVATLKQRYGRPDPYCTRRAR